MLLVSAFAQADTLQYKISGVFPSTPVTEMDSNFNVIGQFSIPTNSAVAPGAAYELAFSFSVPPQLAGTSPQLAVDTVLTYSLNGKPLSSAPNTALFFPSNAGGFVIPQYGFTVGSDVYYWSWVGQQLYNGATDAPDFLTGTFAAKGMAEGLPSLQFVGVNNFLWELPDNAVLSVTSQAANAALSAEPGPQWLVALAGLLCLLAGLIRRTRASAL